MAKPWRTVRIFVSSTFRDMHAERDYLAKVVFPELRERCAKREIHLVDLDLRWGVTEEEAEQGKVLEVILGEIDRSRPFFIGILGERYGSLPEKMTENTKHEYPWLHEYPNHSITALEVIHGVLRNPNVEKHSFFYFRDPQLVNQIPESKRADFSAESPEAARKVAALKEKIRASGRPIMENYPCRWDEISGRIVDLEAFGQRILENVWNAICSEFPEEALEVDTVAEERQMHEAYVEELSRLYCGRIEQKARLTECLLGTDRRPIVITGEAGSGKSAFLASWYRQYTAEHSDSFVFAYFVGASPNSTNHFKLLSQICQELKQKFDLDEEIPRDENSLPQVLAVLLSKASRRKAKIVLLVDALENLSPLKGAHRLKWLLDSMPERIHLIVSSTEGDCLEILRGRKAEEIVLPPLTTNEQTMIIQTLLHEWRRKLDDRQMATLLAHRAAKTPLYLKVALEEIRLFGNFEQLTARIEALPPDVTMLFNQVLSRLEEDNGRELVKEAFTLLSCSRYGLAETELLDLLRQDCQEQFPRALWARLARSARAYLVQRGDLICFLHDFLRQAIFNRYLSEEEKERGVHLRLANYFEGQECSDELQGEISRLKQLIDKGEIRLQPGTYRFVVIPARRLDELPWQLLQAKSWQRLNNFLSDIILTAAFSPLEYELRTYWTQVEANTSFRATATYQPILDTPENYDPSIAWVIANLFSDLGYTSEALSLGQYLAKYYRQIKDTRNLAKSLFQQAVVLQLRDDLDGAMLLLEEAESIHKRLGDKAELANCLGERALILEHKGEWRQAMNLFKDGIEIYRDLKREDGVSRFLINQGCLFLKLGNADEALTMLEEAERIDRELGNKDGLQICLGNQGLALLFRGENLHKILAKHKEEEQICRELGNKDSLSRSLCNQADLYVKLGDLDTAAMLLREAEAICNDLGKKEGLSYCFYYKAEILKKRGEPKMALEMLAEQERICRELEHKEGLQASLHAQADIKEELGEHNAAMKLLKEQEQICRQLGSRYALCACIGDQASILAEKGDLNSSLNLFKEQELICREINNPDQLARSLIAKAGVLAFKFSQPEKGLHEADNALEIAMTHKLSELTPKIRDIMQKMYVLIRLNEEYPKQKRSSIIDDAE